MSPLLPVYLDNHATTRTDPRVVEAMLPWFTEQYGNASSREHEYGWKGEAGVERARAEVAAMVGVAAEEICFTGGATEAINLALRGVAEAAPPAATPAAPRAGSHIISAATEHRATLDTLDRLREAGLHIQILPVDENGLVDPDAVRRAIGPATILVTIMTANNEIGTIAPVAEIGAICHERGVLFHTDAVQAAGRMPIDFPAWHVDLASLSAHKMHGPKGVGALYVSRKARAKGIVSQMTGGGHERGLRSGTLNVPGIVGFGRAASIATLEGVAAMEEAGRLRDRLEAELRNRLEGVAVNGSRARRLPVTASLTFAGARADRVLQAMRDVAVSTGAACSSAQPEPSHVLRALGLDPRAISATLRFGLSRFTTDEEITYAVRRVVEAVTEVRSRVRIAI